jgi:arabinofuranan 3-O-arabinosyltransferase
MFDARTNTPLCGVATRGVKSLLDKNPNTSEFVESSPKHAPAGRASKWWLLGGFVLALTGFVPDAFGRQVFDTKIDLVVDPTTFLHNLFNLWDPWGWFGTVRDQSFGYAFPTASFFAAGHLFAVQPWLLERIWMALVVTAAFWGVVRLAEALNIGSTPTRLAAGAAFALWPAFTILVGSQTSEVAVGALMPWVLIPLVRGSRGGAPIRAAALSAVAVLFMGGVNATVTLYSLVVAVLFLVTRTPSRRRRSLMGWWAAFVGLATAWWVIPLLLLGKYGFNFLPYIETADQVTATMSATSSLTGQGYWTAYLNSGQTPWDQAGITVVLLPVALAGAAMVAAAGLYGIARRDIPERRFLVLSLGLAAVGTMSGYWGSLGGQFGGLVRRILDGPLAPFRNVQKLEPLIALVLVLGIAHALDRAPRRIPRAAWRGIVGTITIVLLASLATPYLMGRVVQGQSFRAIPSYWSEVAKYLSRESPRSTALVVPASGQGQYVWGWPVDEPLEALARSPWTVRWAAPLGGVGSTRMVDAVDLALKTGLPSPGLPSLLNRSGVKYIVVQNDVEWQLSDSPSPFQIHQVLAASGFKRVAQFGPKINTTIPQGPPSLNIDNLGPKAPYPAVEIFDAPTLPGSPNVGSPVTAYPVSTATLVSGGPEGILQLLGTGALRTDQAVVLAGDWRGVYRGPLFAVTDTLRRQDVKFGLLNDNSSFTFTATEMAPAPAGQPVGTSPPRQLLPFSGVNHQTVAVLVGARNITTSSIANLFFYLPEYNPSNVFDGDSSTGWVAGIDSGSVGQWIQITFDRPVDPKGSRIQPLLNGAQTVAEVKVTTDRGSTVTRLRPTAKGELLRVPPGKARFLRVTFVAVAGQHYPANVGIKSISIPGVHVQSYLKPPEEPVGFGARQLDFSFQSAQVDPTEILREPLEPVMTRLFSVPHALAARVTGLAQPRRGTALDALVGSSHLGTSANTPFSEPCGSGPPVIIDGFKYQTTLLGTIGDLVAEKPLILRFCTLGTPVQLGPGTHKLIAPTTQSPFDVSSLTIQQLAPSSTTTAAARPTHVLSWQPQSRSVAIGSGQASYIEVHQNYNTGWTATLNGRTLKPIQLDGWQQGYLVPAGTGGIVRLTFGPERLFLGGALISALGVLLVVLIALGVIFRRLGTKLEPAPARNGRVAKWIPFGLAAGVIFVVGGPLVLAVPVLYLIGSWRANLLPWVAAAGMVAAGIVAALDPGNGAPSGVGSFSTAAQACALVALAAVLVPARDRADSRRERYVRSSADGKDTASRPDDGSQQRGLSEPSEVMH